MIEEKISLSKDAYFKTYIIEHSNYIQSGDTNNWQPAVRPAIIVLPGGGYKYIADSEDEPIIYHYLSKGYSCFSLHYSLNEDSKYPTPLYELFQTIAYIRQHAKEWHINPNWIAVCGFSAGAHLAGLSATQYNIDKIQKNLKLNEEQIKPNAAILCYPITNITRLHSQNPKRVLTWGLMLSTNNSDANVVDFVTNKTCPVFLWHTRTDGIVPVSQSLELIEKLQLNNVPFECHIFGEGYHGLSTNDVLSNFKGALQNGKIVTNVSEWVEMSSNWINQLFEFNN